MTGASGRLGTELKKHFKDIYTPDMCDITLPEDIKSIFDIEWDTLIHCAAMTDTKECEENPFDTYRINSVATYMLAYLCHLHRRKMVYISTDHVFDGKKGNYKEYDIPNPQGVYAKSKLMGEWFVLSNPKNLVIRTSFMKDFPFEKAFTDKYFSADTVDTVAKEISLAIKSDLMGMWHIAGKRKSVYTLAKKLNPNTKPMKLSDKPISRSGLPYLKDTSLNISKWLKVKR